MGAPGGKFLVTLGLLSLAHAAYSAAQHRAYLRLTEEEFTTLPVDILLQSILGLLLMCFGIVNVVGKFREIKAAADMDKRGWENLGNRSSFYSFAHRGKALFGSK